MSFRFGEPQLHHPTRTGVKFKTSHSLLATERKIYKVTFRGWLQILETVSKFLRPVPNSWFSKMFGPRKWNNGSRERGHITMSTPACVTGPWFSGLNSATELGAVHDSVPGNYQEFEGTSRIWRGKSRIWNDIKNLDLLTWEVAKQTRIVDGCDHMPMRNVPADTSFLLREFLAVSDSDLWHQEFGWASRIWLSNSWFIKNLGTESRIWNRDRNYIVLRSGS